MKVCIVNVSVGDENSWYHRGSQRLFDSLRAVGYTGEILYKKKLKSAYGSPYADKLAAIREAMGLGYEIIIYLDCSITALRPIDDMIDFIDKHGYYFYRTGFNCAQTATDYLLAVNDVDRNTAETWPETATNVIGIDCRKENGRKLVQMMADSVSNGSICGEKFPTESQRLKMSKDPRFLFCRQDQSVISIAAHKLGMPPLAELNHFVFRWEDPRPMNPSVIFKLKGGE